MTESPSDQSPSTKSERRYTPFVPILLISVLLLVSTLGQTASILSQRSQAEMLSASLDQRYEASQKINAQLNALTKGVVKLAASGNENAKQIQSVLAKNGIQIKE